MKKHEELSPNPEKQAHRTAQGVVNSTNQDKTTLQELIFVRHMNKEDKKSTMTSEKLVMRMTVTVLNTPLARKTNGTLVDFKPHSGWKE